MKKAASHSKIAFAVLFVVYNLLVTVIPFRKAGTFWMSYGFTIAAILIGAVSCYIAFVEKPGAKSRFYGFPIARIGVIYLTVQIVLGITFTLLGKWVPMWAGAAVYAVLFGAACVGLIAADAVVEEIHKQDHKIRKDTAMMYSLQTTVNQIAGACEDSEYKKAVSDFAEELKYSDPVSGASTQNIEQDLKEAVDNLQQAVVDGDCDVINELIKKAASLLSERNRICKASKNADIDATNAEEEIENNHKEKEPRFRWTAELCGMAAGTAIIVIAVVVVNAVVLSNVKYKKADVLLQNQQYQEAASVFSKVDGIKSADARIAEDYCEKMIAAVQEFKNAGAVLLDKNAEIDELIEQGNALVAEKNPTLEENASVEFETAVTVLQNAVMVVPDQPTELEKLQEVTRQMLDEDYSEAVTEYNNHLQKYEDCIARYQLVENPTENYAISCLNRVAHVAGIAAVTKDNDPNGQLNKIGGYTAQVYFASDLIENNDLTKSAIIEKGTDCGGSLEIYSRSEDAEKRDTYLAQFDGSTLASGSHMVIGTVVLRISSELTATQQQEMTADILESLTYMG